MGAMIRRTLIAAVVVLSSVAAHAGWSDYLKKVKDGLGSNAGSKGTSSAKGDRAVLSVRGLDENREKAAGDADRRNFRAIDKLDQIKISPEDLKRFLKDGGLDAR